MKFYKNIIKKLENLAFFVYKKIKINIINL